jgi:hypothetical protein
MREHFFCAESYDLMACPFRAFIRHYLSFDHHFLSSSAGLAAQDLDAKPASTGHADVAPFSMFHGDELQPARQDLTGDSLLDAPLPTGQAQGLAQDPATRPE